MVINDSYIPTRLCADLYFLHSFLSIVSLLILPIDYSLFCHFCKLCILSPTVWLEFCMHCNLACSFDSHSITAIQYSCQVSCLVSSPMLNHNTFLVYHDTQRKPLCSQGMAFTLEERQLLGIHGLIPPRFKTQEEQLELCRLNVERYQEDLNKYIYLMGLQVRVGSIWITTVSMVMQS